MNIKAKELIKASDRLSNKYGQSEVNSFHPKDETTTSSKNQSKIEPYKFKYYEITLYKAMGLLYGTGSFSRQNFIEWLKINEQLLKANEPDVHIGYID